MISQGQGALLSADSVLHRAAERLAQQFAGLVGEETVERVVFESYVTLGRAAKVRAHLPALAERFAKDRLTALAQSKGLVVKAVPEVLYICVHNSGRSQMAAALTRHLSGGRVHVRSAGSQPTGDGILPSVITVLEEIGIRVDEEFPKPLTDDVVRAADAVVTMGCGDRCPLYPGKRYLDWELADPATLDMDGVRQVRDQIREQVVDLLSEISPTA
jgi:arsenate reductase